MYVHVFVFRFHLSDIGNHDVSAFDIDDFIPVLVPDGQRIVQPDIPIRYRPCRVSIQVEQHRTLNIRIM
jgi:hypothetical protein